MFSVMNAFLSDLPSMILIGWPILRILRIIKAVVMHVDWQLFDPTFQLQEHLAIFYLEQSMNVQVILILVNWLDLG